HLETAGRDELFALLADAVVLRLVPTDRGVDLAHALGLVLDERERRVLLVAVRAVVRHVVDADLLLEGLEALLAEALALMHQLLAEGDEALEPLAVLALHALRGLDLL